VSISRIQLVEAGGTIPAEAITTFGRRRVWGSGRGVVREALRCRVGNGVELAGEVTRITDYALTLGPDPIRIEIELMDALLRNGRDVRCMARRLLAVLVGLPLTRRDDLVGGSVSLLENRRYLPTDALDRLRPGGVRRLLNLLQLADLTMQLRDVGIDLDAVISLAGRFEKLFPAPH
jgi:hypothetical protein